MNSDLPRCLIPSEEWTVLRYTVSEAHELARNGHLELGRQLLRRGLRKTREWKEEAWGNTLTWSWIDALRKYEAEVG